MKHEVHYRVHKRAH